MNITQEAINLLCKFEEVTCPNWEEGNNEYTKKCAIIHIDEMIRTIEYLFDKDYPLYKHYTNLKREIQSL